MSDRTFAMINGALAVVWLWISWVSTDVFMLAVAALQAIAAVAYYLSYRRAGGSVE